MDAWRPLINDVSDDNISHWHIYNLLTALLDEGRAGMNPFFHSNLNHSDVHSLQYCALQQLAWSALIWLMADKMLYCR